LGEGDSNQKQSKYDSSDHGNIIAPETSDSTLNPHFRKRGLSVLSRVFRSLLDFLLALCEHGVVNVIGSTTIKRYAALHADAAEELLRWNKAASHAVWRDVNEVRLHFPDADQYKSLLIFNIRHNYYRLIRNTREEVGRHGRASHRQQEVRAGIG
jgi:mRNA-degrading endonuclease HigB of HigAB toxin-antitoxin module